MSIKEKVGHIMILKSSTIHSEIQIKKYNIICLWVHIQKDLISDLNRFL
jgi:hypothetical protein